LRRAVTQDRLSASPLSDGRRLHVQPTRGLVAIPVRPILGHLGAGVCGCLVVDHRRDLPKVVAVVRARASTCSGWRTWLWRRWRLAAAALGKRAGQNWQAYTSGGGQRVLVRARGTHRSSTHVMTGNTCSGAEMRPSPPGTQPTHTHTHEPAERFGSGCTYAECKRCASPGPPPVRWTRRR
jgi:hypothetical protein